MNLVPRRSCTSTFPLTGPLSCSTSTRWRLPTHCRAWLYQFAPLAFLLPLRFLCSLLLSTLHSRLDHHPSYSLLRQWEHGVHLLDLHNTMHCMELRFLVISPSGWLEHSTPQARCPVPRPHSNCSSSTLHLLSHNILSIHPPCIRFRTQHTFLHTPHHCTDTPAITSRHQST